jgi:NAD(P)H-flavin reductase
MAMALNRNLMEYKPFVVRDVVELSDGLRLIRFYQNVEAGPGQFVFIKLDGKHAKPFSVADDLDGLEIVVRKVGETTSKMFELKRNNVVRVRGPYGKKYSAVNGVHTIYVGAGCGIAPIYHAVQHHRGPKMVFIGAKTAKELVYLDRFMMSSTVVCSTDDGSEGYKGNIAQLLDFYMKQIPKQDSYFFNCGPEVMLKAVDEIERRYTSPDRITHLVERMTSCGISICGKCSIPSGHLACSDGPFFDAVTFRPGEYTRDKTGAKVYFK